MGQENVGLEYNEHNYIFMSNHINILLKYFSQTAYSKWEKSQ